MVCMNGARPAGRRVQVASLALVVALQVAPLRRARAEDHIDFKYMWYQEDGDRVRVLTPAVLLEKELTASLSIRIEGVYNAISGASPTGAPPIRHQQAAPSVTVPVYAEVPYSSYVDDAREEEDREEHGERGEREEHEGRGERSRWMTLAPRRVNAWNARAGATPSSKPRPVVTPSQPSSGTKQVVTTQQTAPAASGGTSTKEIPLANIEDEREALNIELTNLRGDHAITGGLSLSSESDYESMAVSLRDSIAFNKKNTTLTLGGAYTHDSIDAFVRGTTESKDTVDLLAGLTQVLGPQTLFNVNFVLSNVSGYMDDQYKVVELNGKLIPEHRPDSKDKKILYFSLLHLFKSIDGTAEVGYRFYDDSFGTRGDTVEFAWYQKLSPQWTLKPMLRFYQQTAADFYGVTFSGSPQYYSSDYRVSELEALGYGLKVIWKPVDRFALDLAVERYEQSGRDGVTDAGVYPSANIVTMGARWWF